MKAMKIRSTAEEENALNVTTVRIKRALLWVLSVFAVLVAGVLLFDDGKDDGGEKVPDPLFQGNVNHIDVMTWTNEVAQELEHKFPCNRGAGSLCYDQYDEAPFVPNSNLRPPDGHLATAAVRSPFLVMPGDDIAYYTLRNKILEINKQRNVIPFAPALCKAFDDAFPLLGLNGLARLSQEYFAGDMDLPHLVGTYVAVKADEMGLPQRSGAAAAAIYFEKTLHEEKPPEEGYALIHSNAVAQMMRRFPGRANADAFWKIALDEVCEPFFDLPADTGPCECFLFILFCFSLFTLFFFFQ